MKGRIVVLGMVVVGVALAIVAAVTRSRHGAMLPLRPGAVLLLTIERSEINLGPFDDGTDGAIRFPNAHGVSSEVVASLGAIVTGRMPRESGLVRQGDAIARDVPVLGELLAEAGFTGAVFTRSDVSLSKAGVLRGCTRVVEAVTPGAADVDVVAAATEHLIASGTAPTFCHLHLRSERDDELTRAFERLAAAGFGSRLVIAAVSLANPEGPTLVLRLPPGLIPRDVDERDVSLLDVVPSLREVFGLAGRPELMEPFLLDPRTRAPRFFLFTRPLAVPPEADRDCDAVKLLAAEHHYSFDPSTTPVETIDDKDAAATPALRDELRRILQSAYATRVEPGEGGAPGRARFIGRAR